MQDHQSNGACLSWLQELSRFWNYYNWQYLRDALRPPSFSISSGHSRLGSWNSEHRILSISEEHILQDPWMGVMETLRHEMAHQYVDEVLRVRGETGHGPAFKRACELLRVSPAATGKGGEVSPFVGPGAASDGGIRDRISKLLSLAGSPNEHEAQAAMAKARHLLLKYNVSTQDLPDPRADYVVRQLGEVTPRRQRWQLVLGSILNRFFFVQVLWVFSYDARLMRRGDILMVHGSPINVDMAEYVFGFLTRLLPNLWAMHKDRTRTRSNEGRLHFYWGVLVGFDEKLGRQNEKLAREDALVWKGDPGLKEFYRYLHPRIHSVSAKPIFVDLAFEHGKMQGRRITLNKPLTSKGDAVRGLIN